MSTEKGNYFKFYNNSGCSLHGQLKADKFSKEHRQFFKKHLPPGYKRSGINKFVRDGKTKAKAEEIFKQSVEKTGEIEARLGKALPEDEPEYVKMNKIF